jgi:prepilin-type N-terminal cleavage/methylation domain-containing protein
MSDILPTPHASPPPGGARGFTLLELVVMLVLVGVLAAVSAPYLPDTGAYNDRGDAELLVAGLRTAQQQAFSRGPDADVRFILSGRQIQVVVNGKPDPVWTKKLSGNQGLADRNCQFYSPGNRAPGENLVRSETGDCLNWDVGQELVRVASKTGYAWREK